MADAAVVALNIGAAAVRGLTGEIGHTRSFRSIVALPCFQNDRAYFQTIDFLTPLVMPYNLDYWP